MTDEENEAIEWLKRLVKINKRDNLDDTFAEILLNLIEKQSKEIEKLSDKLTQKICKGVEEEILEEYRQTIISKDKEIEELKDKNKFYNTAYNLGKTYANKKWKDKIKAKIEEWQKEKEFYNKDADREWGQYNNWDWIDSFINELQSLLEKE